MFSQIPNLKGFDPLAVFRSPSRWGPIGSTRGFRYAHFAFGSRIARAARLLKYGHSSIKTIAHGLRFTDSSHFCHAFVAQYGMTPAQYRAVGLDEGQLSYRR